ncbi:NADP-dependent oxidoreductase [Clostridium nigeriense]|uniref:NADP-dependent oxidoreductase n=1 Tax=Clostridium nigeriense TaxID=1805470 RepID=UPI003D33F38B
MKAVQINKYSKEINVTINDIPVPKVSDNEVLVKVKAAAVNPLELLILTGSVKLIQDYDMPLTLGNELSGIIEEVGRNVTGFKKGDKIYSRLPIDKIGAFAEYIAVNADAISHMPKNLDFKEAVAVPLTGLTAYQGLHEELEAKAGQTVFIPGGSGSFGEMAIPIAKSMGLNVIVSGNTRSREQMMKLGVDLYVDYTKENYWDIIPKVDFVIDTLGPKEFERELSVLKKGGRLLSLRTGPNKKFAERNKFPFWKQKLFSLAGAKYDKLARKEEKEYRFIFVRADGEQLKEITRIVEENNIVPRIDSRIFTIEQTGEALNLVASGHTNGKVIIQF